MAQRIQAFLVLRRAFATAPRKGTIMPPPTVPMYKPGKMAMGGAGAAPKVIRTETAASAAKEPIAAKPQTSSFYRVLAVSGKDAFVGKGSEVPWELPGACD
jgi:hypothetical protein